jgi:nucleotide-binding universal stress UspA family protein
METFKKILFPVDLSEVSNNITPWVIMMAKSFGAQVNIVFVMRSFDYLHSFQLGQPQIDNFVLSFSKGAEEKLKQFVDNNFKDYTNFRTEIVQGDPADEIIQYITSRSIDLVIMGTHGRKGLNRILFGSVADRVVKTSPVPVLTVNPYRTLTPEI